MRVGHEPGEDTVVIVSHCSNADKRVAKRWPVARRSAGAGVLRVVIELVGPAAVLTAGGEVDGTNIAAFTSVLRDAARTAAPGPLIVDVDQLDFIAACGFSALAEQARQCGNHGSALAVVSGRPFINRVVIAGQWDKDLTVFRSQQDALTALTVATPVTRQPIVGRQVAGGAAWALSES